MSDPVGSDFDEHLDEALREPAQAAEFLKAAGETQDLSYFKRVLGRISRIFEVTPESTDRKARDQMIAEQLVVPKFSFGRETVIRPLPGSIGDDSDPRLTLQKLKQAILDLDGVAAVNLQEPSKGDLERVVKQNRELWQKYRSLKRILIDVREQAKTVELRCEQLQAQVNDALMEADTQRVRSDDLWRENEKLEQEIEILRRYGNKDCTAMADEYLQKHRSGEETE